jgi:N-acetylmuramoyl-L-alanine amidase
VVVIDPGHGGANLGAPSVVRGVYEKSVTLDLARRVARELDQRGILGVLTRNRDEYLLLRQRVRKANEMGADLFVSLHCNATEKHTRRGYETFILTPEALDVDARAIRSREGAPRPGVDEDTSLLLDEVERGAAFPIAADLATAIQEQLREVRGPTGDRGVRQASMHVLLGATMPAVLVEVGFIDHPEEGLELLDSDVRADIARAIAVAIEATL